ncbi:MAG TPA: potassium transporter TrkG [Gemmatimonadaceae bacterium]|nr:potassium transporter TrkG [Gemmatimonadaceae bacterium]
MRLAAKRRWMNPWWEERPQRPSFWRQLTPAQLFAASFLALIVFGSVGLKTLPGLYTGPSLGWTDAIFTAASAACVTGLMLVDTSTYFTPVGQAFLLLLIQLGGLGMIAFTTLIILALGRRLSLRHERLAATVAEVAPRVRVESLARNVMRFTFAIEAAGAGVLYAAWAPRLGWTEALWPAVFHSVSAFCNAGFSIFPDSLIGLQRSPDILLIITVLVLAGSLGFLTVEEVRLWRGTRHSGKRRYRMSVHSRLALVTTAILVVGGWVAFAAFEWRGVFADLPAAHKVVNALFLSITPRSAGFNSVDYTQATDSTNFLTILLMFVGGSPGSTAGGVKTTTIALLFLLAWSRLRGNEVTHAWGRSIPEETIQRAVGLALTAFALTTASIFLYTFTEHTGVDPERTRFLPIMFEAASAINVVGLSLGITETLSSAGKWITIFLMFVGRVGPLTFAAALALSARRHREQFRYAHEDVIVG